MARYRVFETETAELLVPCISPSETIEVCKAGEYFTADTGEVILAPSVRNGDVLYIRITSARRPTASPRAADPRLQEVKHLEPSKHYVATGFLGLDGELEEEIPEPARPWWKRLID